VLIKFTKMFFKFIEFPISCCQPPLSCGITLRCSIYHTIYYITVNTNSEAQIISLKNAEDNQHYDIQQDNKPNATHSNTSDVMLSVIYVENHFC
jgi:hypothetical protein